jgi:predicted transcriptional regulator
MTNDEERGLPALSEAQTEIMNVVWEQHEATLVSVHEALSDRRALAKNTVQTQLTRLVEKGWLTHRAEGKAFYYRATIGKDDARKGVLRRVLDTVFEGSTEGLMLALLGEKKLSKETADRMRQLIEEAEADK